MEKYFKTLLKNKDAKVYRVGGAVRDKILKQNPKDYDYLVTGVPFNYLIYFLQTKGKVEHVGATFGVLKFYPANKNIKKEIDIALPRKEISIGPGHKQFKVEFDHTLTVMDDLGRRDFTINSIAFDIKTKRYIDPFGGLQDIKDKIIRHVSEKAFEEDPLRILRAIQFSARLNFKITQKTLNLMSASVNLLIHVSPERIAVELNKLLSSDKPSIGFDYLYECGALKLLLPELCECKNIKQTRKGQASTVFDHIMLALDAVPKDNLLIRWAAVFHDMAKPECKILRKGKNSFIGHDKTGAKLAKKYLTAWKFPNNFTADVAHLIKHHMFDAAPKITSKAVRRLINKVGKEYIFDLIELRKADRNGTTEKLSMWKIDNLVRKIKIELANKPFSINDLAIDGTDIMEHTGLKSGPEIGLIQKILLLYVLYHDVLNSKSDLQLHIPYPGKEWIEYCPNGTIFRLNKILEMLNSESVWSWDCGHMCGNICANKD